MKETSVKSDNKGNVVSVKVPNYKLRNEAKVLSFDWDCCPSDVHVLRSKGKTLHENVDFCKAVGDLKRQNNLSDNEGLEESLETIVSTWPEVLYLTQEELSGESQRYSRTRRDGRQVYQNSQQSGDVGRFRYHLRT